MLAAKEQDRGIHRSTSPQARIPLVAGILPAKGGDIPAARLILERALPPLKSAAETLTLPGAETPASQGRTVLGACAQGDISPDEAATLMHAISAQARVVEVEELTQRVEQLEQALHGRK